VVEVAAPADAIEELGDKKALYFEKGAREVWLCSEDGVMAFYNAKGKLTESL